MIGRNLNSAVKQYVFEMLRQNPDDSVKIASERELCARFNTTRPTLRKVLAELAEEGVLLIRHGAGAFTNPMSDQKPRYDEDARTIGILLGYGSGLFFDPYYWNILDAVYKELHTDYWINLPFFQLVNDGREAAEELLKYKLDGVLWIHPDERRAEVAEILEQHGVPVVCVGRMLGGSTATVMVDYQRAGRNLAQYFLRRGQHRPLVAVKAGNVYMELAEAFEAEMLRAGFPWDRRLLFLRQSDYREQLLKLKREKITFDGIFVFGTESIHLQNMLQDVYGRDVFSELNSVIVNSMCYRHPDHPYLDINAGILGRQAGRYLQARLFGGEAVKTQLLDFDVLEPQQSKARTGAPDTVRKASAPK